VNATETTLNNSDTSRFDCFHRNSAKMVK